MPEQTLGEPLREEWVSGIKIEEHRSLIRLVQPVEDQLTPNSVILPKGWATDIAEFIEAWDDGREASSSGGQSDE
jgi:hypothetical protein